MKALKIAGLALLVLLLAVLGVYATMRAGLWNTRYAAVKAKWAGPPSTFVDVDGVQLHVRDEGSGPAVIMLHGSIVNLHEWDPVAERLKSRYRVIRLDWPPYGVTGLDPTGVYTTQRASDLLEGLVEKLHLTRFTIVATSNGANLALQYVADHPEPVTALALSILPLGRPSQTRAANPLIVWLGRFHEKYLPDYHPKFWFRLIVKDTTGPHFKPPPRMIDMIYDADNLPGAAARQRAYIASNTKLFRTTDVGAVATKVHVPVLLQWCSLDTVISQSAQASVARFTHAPVQLIVYPDVGHFPMWEDTDRFTRDLGAFLDRVNAPAKP